MTVHLISKLCYEITALVSQAKGRLFFCGHTAKSEPPNTRQRVVAPVYIIANIYSLRKV